LLDKPSLSLSYLRAVSQLTGPSVAKALPLW
jgi:hypothetical protein